uniref:Uncharacterized protein n=1 Tax=Salarias fasciatus TaxID=181472 RepID=A0A672G3C9_SALFA
MINKAQAEYRPVATRGSILYFLITEMSMVNVMYQTSLSQFLRVFDLSLERSDKSRKTKQRIKNIINYLTYEVFRYTVRGLYEEHKFIFTVLLALKIDLQREAINHDEFQVFVKGESRPVSVTAGGFVSVSVSKNGKRWKAWFDLDAPEEGPVAQVSYHHSVNPVLLHRSCCPDRTLCQAVKYVGESVGGKFAEPVILNLRSTWQESDPRTPLICFLSMGSDPTDQIEFECNAISMGQGQEVHARKLLQTSMTQGGWVLLQNCHLGLDFMEELLETLHVSPSFMVVKLNPLVFCPLQSSIKFTNDPPQGIRAGLKRTFTGISQEQLEVSDLPLWKPLLYSVAFLHTAVQERRKFGALGWNIPYEFNSADFSASVEFVKRHLEDCGPGKDVSWVTLRYMLAEVQYGGRVTDDYDKRLLQCFAQVRLPPPAVEDYLEYIQSLPPVDSPQALGLHPNADITYQTNTSALVFDTITNIQPKESGGGSGETRESAVYSMAEDMLRKLPRDYVPHKVGGLDCCVFAHKSSTQLKCTPCICVVGLSGHSQAEEDGSSNLQDALDNIFDARVPNLWKKISWESSTLGFWFTELLERNQQLHSWVFKGRPQSFWMTGFFNPQGESTAFQTAVHRLSTQPGLTPAPRVSDCCPCPQVGVYVHGLYLDGAGWDKSKSCLVESSPKVLFTPMPVIHIFAVNSTAPAAPGLYVCPVYKKPQRTDLNYITAVTLPSGQSPDQWVLRGVALLCDIK